MEHLTRNSYLQRYFERERGGIKRESRAGQRWLSYTGSMSNDQTGSDNIEVAEEGTIGVTQGAPVGSIRPLPNYPSWQICTDPTLSYLLSSSKV